MRISGVELRKNKRVLISLRDIFGIGPTRAELICKQVDIDLSKRVRDLTDEEGAKIQAAINHNNWVIEKELRREISDNIRKTISMKNYIGLRRLKGLPLRSKTKRNAKTAKKLMKISGGK